MMPATLRSVEVRRERMKSIHRAIDEGWSLTELAKRWGVTRQRAAQWMIENGEDSARKEIVSNGRQSAANKIRDFDLPSRLELIQLCRANGWTHDKIAMAVGVTTVAIWALVRRHAPDGLTDALADFQQDEAA